MGLANVEAMDGYMLADALTPRQFSELSGLDYEVAQLVYAAYAAEDEDYSKLMGNIASYRVPLIDMFLYVCDQVDEGYVTLDAEQTDMLMDAKSQMQNAKAQLSGEDYSRMLIYLTLPESGDETYSFIDTIRGIAQEYYPDGNVYVAGNSTNEYDFKKSFATDNLVVSIVSIIIVLLVLLFTFKSVGMGGYVDGALGEIDNIDIRIGGDTGGDTSDIEVPDIEDIDIGELPDISVPDYDIVVTPDLGGLAAAISGIDSQLSMLNGEISGATGAVANDVRAINEKFNELSNTMFDAIFTVGTEDGDILKDTSGVDIDLVKLGKVSANTNTGAVSGDLNIGGIAGAMAIEYEAAPEDDVTSNISAEYKREYELKAVLQNCTNKGTVTARRSYVGGVAGRMDLGIITGCRGFGSISSESGDYVGGVAGLASAAVRSCWAKCTLSGGKYVGGIAGSGVEEALTGSGSTVTGCVSMVGITDSAQYYGAVSGSDAGEYLENYFVSDTLPGIDGRSVYGKAEPISYEELTGIDVLPEEFTAMQLSFVADGETLKTVEFNYGDSFGEDVYPEIPAKDGYYAKWDRTELNDLCFDTVVTAEYACP